MALSKEEIRAEAMRMATGIACARIERGIAVSNDGVVDLANDIYSFIVEK